jgi:hypothetical protein
MMKKEKAFEILGELFCVGGGSEVLQNVPGMLP